MVTPCPVAVTDEVDGTATDGLSAGAVMGAEGKVVPGAGTVVDGTVWVVAGLVGPVIGRVVVGKFVPAAGFALCRAEEQPAAPTMVSMVTHANTAVL
jgi:hypothetical protein